MKKYKTGEMKSELSKKLSTEIEHFRTVSEKKDTSLREIMDAQCKLFEAYSDVVVEKYRLAYVAIPDEMLSMTFKLGSGNFIVECDQKIENLIIDAKMLLKEYDD